MGNSWSTIGLKHAHISAALNMSSCHTLGRIGLDPRLGLRFMKPVVVASDELRDGRTLLAKAGEIRVSDAGVMAKLRICSAG